MLEIDQFHDSQLRLKSVAVALVIYPLREEDAILLTPKQGICFGVGGRRFRLEPEARLLRGALNGGSGLEERAFEPL